MPFVILPRFERFFCKRRLPSLASAVSCATIDWEMTSSPTSSSRESSFSVSTFREATAAFRFLTDCSFRVPVTTCSSTTPISTRILPTGFCSASALSSSSFEIAPLSSRISPIGRWLPSAESSWFCVTRCLLSRRSPSLRSSSATTSSVLSCFSLCTSRKSRESISYLGRESSASGRDFFASWLFSPNCSLIIFITSTDCKSASVIAGLNAIAFFLSLSRRDSHS